MAATKPTSRTCANGHRFQKSSDCLVCPVCEAERKSATGLPTSIGAPARRALEREGIKTLETLSTYSENDLLALHGMGKSTIPKLKEALANAGLTFKGQHA